MVAKRRSTKASASEFDELCNALNTIPPEAVPDRVAAQRKLETARRRAEALVARVSPSPPRSSRGSQTTA